MEELIVLSCRMEIGLIVQNPRKTYWRAGVLQFEAKLYHFLGQHFDAIYGVIES